MVGLNKRYVASHGLNPDRLAGAAPLTGQMMTPPSCGLPPVSTRNRGRGSATHAQPTALTARDSKTVRITMDKATCSIISALAPRHTGTSSVGPNVVEVSKER